MMKLVDQFKEERQDLEKVRIIALNNLCFGKMLKNCTLTAMLGCHIQCKFKLLP